ncbi:MAG: DUF4417 domain-containing protein, partial [Victivallaceae bacterium]
MGKRKDYDLDRIYKLSQIELQRTAGDFQMPTLKPETVFPEGLIDFNDAMRYDRFSSHVHFYMDDGKFECLWRDPERYFSRLKSYAGIFTPNFSLYTDMPIAMQIWNTFRSRLIGQMMQSAGIKVIPSVTWADKGSFAFCFDGLPKSSIVAVSSVGVWRDKVFSRKFMRGLSAMIAALEPSGIAFYGKVPSSDFGKIVIKNYPITT